jgi:hypothetical protein
MTAFRHEGRRWLWVSALLLALAVLSTLPYLRSLALPMISDDYLQVDLARKYGPVSSWPALAADPLYRCRSTSLVLTYWTERFFGTSPLVFHLTSLFLHILNTWLIFAAGAWKKIGWRVAFVAAAFFGIYQGHQEAVIWYSALPELLLFLFGFSCVLLWMRWVRAGSAGPYATALICYILALLSKESAVALIPVLALITWMETRSFRRMFALAPFCLLTGIYIIGIFAGRTGNQHFHDGTFSLQAPFWIVWVNSYGRLLWLWSLISLLALVAWREWRRWRPILDIALVWIGITLLPYCFLTYMPRIPSRHTYLASAGLGLIIAAGFLALRERVPSTRRWLPGCVAIVMLVHQCGYVWTRKHAQFVERAEPTEALIRYVRSVHGPVYLHCFPYDLGIARLAVEMGAGKPASMLVAGPPSSGDIAYVFCMGDRSHRPIDKAGAPSARAQTGQSALAADP